MDKIKQILNGIALIISGIFLENMQGIWFPVLGTISLNYAAFFIGSIGIILVIKSFRKKD